MKFACVTSMNKTYFDRCGKYMLASYKEYANHIPLYLYNEDFTTDYTSNLQGWNLGKDYEDFIQRWLLKSSVTKFAKKGFSIIHAMENIDCDRLIWIDADCILTKSLDIDLLKSITSKKTLSSHFSVYHMQDEKEYHSCETGFFILNKQHSKFEDFKNTYKSIYVKDDYKNLRRFYDGEVYGEAVNRLNGPWMNNLNISKKYKTPISKSILKDYIKHYKGKGLKESRFSN
jgi:hypothetical protein